VILGSRSETVSPIENVGQGKLAGSARRALNPARVVDDALLPGSIISGRFRLQKLLGRGGMASVWQAVHLTLESQVAIKFLEPRWSSSNEVRWRFEREATAIARIRSPHVVQVLDYGFTENGRGFIVMELLEGEDLGRHLARASKLDSKDTLTIISQACRGLGKAHSAHIIHRDIKPENLFLTRDEDGTFVKLLDFGVAKGTGVGDDIHQTDTGQLVGTPLYMSPEQALGRSIDSRCDLYSLATVAYRCLTGRAPFVEKHVGELLVAISTAIPPPPSAFEGSLPNSVDAWFASMFAKNPDERCCQTVRELAASFEAACNGTPPTSATHLATTAVSVDTPTQPGEPDERRAPSAAARVREPTPSTPLHSSRRENGSPKRRAWLVLVPLAMALGLAVPTRSAPPRLPPAAREMEPPSRGPTAANLAKKKSDETPLQRPPEETMRDPEVVSRHRISLPSTSDPPSPAEQPAPSPNLVPVPATTPARGARQQKPHEASMPPRPRSARGATKSDPLTARASKQKRAESLDDGAAPAEPARAPRSPSTAPGEQPERKPSLALDRGSPWGEP
jgi:eukaryotic-like serine/threonine-protein kinase